MTGYDDQGNAIPPPPRPIEYRDVDASGWWLSLLVGVLLVGLGVWMLTNLFESVVVLAWIAGVSLIVGGVVEVAALGGRQALGWLARLGALLLIGAGVVVLVWPDITLWALALLAGATLLVAGLFRIVMAFYNRQDDPSVPDGSLTVVVGSRIRHTDRALTHAWVMPPHLVIDQARPSSVGSASTGCATAGHAGRSR